LSCVVMTRGGRRVTLILPRGTPLGLIPAGPNHARRIEAGILNNQSDMDLTTNLYELGLEWQIEPKQRFIGKEALERIRRDGIKRRLVGFEVHGEPAQHEFEGPWVVYKDGTSVGRASAFVYSHTLKKNIGLAMIKIEYTAPGQRIEVQRLPGEPRHKAAVVTLPFIDPKKEIPSDGWTPPPGHRAIPDSLTITIEQAVARVPIWRKASSLTASPISGGVTNVNYRVEVDGEAFVVRIEGQGTERLGIDRQREYQCLVAECRTGVGPEVVYCLPAGGILVTRFIDGRNLSAEEMGRPEMIARAVRS